MQLLINLSHEIFVISIYELSSEHKSNITFLIPKFHSTCYLNSKPFTRCVVL